MSSACANGLVVENVGLLTGKVSNEASSVLVSLAIAAFGRSDIGAVKEQVGL